MHCTNCTRDGHTKERCFVQGGGKEGQGSFRWRAPEGLEPRQSFIDTAKAGRLAKKAAIAAAIAAATTPTPSAPAAVSPAPPVASMPAPAAALTNPMATYALGIIFDEGASPF
ncbi:hypothetical protein B0H13DRAFT_1915570 [Mycena leptocephala]|nr:hypothetical protein B0H13DRAFT_1915570 [Mycena leptocephala]